MDEITAQSVNDELQFVVAYGEHISTAFHQYTLGIQRDIHRILKKSRPITDSALSSLKQISRLLQDETQHLKDGTGKALFSAKGLSYTRCIVKECARSLLKVEEIFSLDCLPLKELHAKRGVRKHWIVPEADIVCSEMKIDEKAFLNRLEKTRMPGVYNAVDDIMARLEKLQRHLVLVYQVVTVGRLSSDLSAGKVDVQEIFSFHDRIQRTAEVVGEFPRSLICTRPSFSDSDYSDDSGSDDSAPVSRRPPIVSRPMPSGPPRFVPPPPPQAPVVGLPKVHIAENVNPPSYTENSNSAPPTALKLPVEKKVSIEEPATKSQNQGPAKNEVVLAKPATPLPRLFAAKPHGIGFQLRSFFRSKESLAAEMRKVLGDTDSHLLAFTIDCHIQRMIPHSAFHSVESTHMKTILAQLNGRDDTWYKTYISLQGGEALTLRDILYPCVNGKPHHERDLIALKVVQEETKPDAWLAALREFRAKKRHSRGSMSPPRPGRILLAIVREKLVDGKPLLPASETFIRCGPWGPDPRIPPPTNTIRIIPQPAGQAFPPGPPPPPPSFVTSRDNRMCVFPNYNIGPAPPTVCGPPPPEVRGPIRVAGRRPMDVYNNSIMARGPGPSPPPNYPQAPPNHLNPPLGFPLPPRPMPQGQPGPPGPPVRILQVSPIRITRLRSKRGSVSRGNSRSSWDSDSSDSCGSGHKKRRCARRQNRRSRRSSTYNSDDSDEDDEGVDVMKIGLKLKRGDDIVQKLLEKWTPQTVGVMKFA